MEFFCQYNLCVQKYLLNHVISEKLSNITCTNVLPKFRRRYTHTPWNLSNEFYKTTMCCFFVFFLNNFLNFKCMPVLFISWEKKIIGKNYFCQAAPCVTSKISSFYAIIKPFTFSWTFTLNFWPFLWKQHFTKIHIEYTFLRFLWKKKIS